MALWDTNPGVSGWLELGLDTTPKTVVPKGPSQATLRLLDELAAYFRSLPVEGRRGEFRMEVGDLLAKAQTKNLSPCEVWLEAAEHRWFTRQRSTGDTQAIGEIVWTKVIELAKKYI